MATTLEGSTALVTGATAGIGRAVALQLAQLGAEVVVHGRSEERGAKLVQEIQNAGGKARFVAADLTDPDDVRRLAAEAGAVDILVQQLVPGMAERGNGVVVNLSTAVATIPARAGGIYGATKAGVELLTRVWPTSSAGPGCG